MKKLKHLVFSSLLTTLLLILFLDIKETFLAFGFCLLMIFTTYIYIKD